MNFDKWLQTKMSKEAYHAAKRKAGSMSSTKGMPREYARQNMAKARLFSPQLVGHSVTITPKHPYGLFRVGSYYEWKVVEEGEGVVFGHTPLTASEVWEHFKVIKKGKQ